MRKILSKRLKTFVVGCCLGCIGQVVPCWMLTGCNNFNTTEKEEIKKQTAYVEAAAEKEAATKLQAHFRGYKAQQEFKKKNEAATKLQAHFREYKARKETKHRAEEERKRQEEEAKRAAADKVAQGRKKQEEAANKLQAHYREYKARKECEKKEEEHDDIDATEHSITTTDNDSLDDTKWAGIYTSNQNNVATGLGTINTVDPKNRLNAGNMRNFIKEHLNFKASTTQFEAGGLEKPVFYYDDSNSEEMVYVALAHNRDPSKLAPQDKTNRTYQTCGEQDVAATLQVVIEDFKSNTDRRTAKILMPLQQIGKEHWVLLDINTQKRDSTSTEKNPLSHSMTPRVS